MLRLSRRTLLQSGVPGTVGPNIRKAFFIFIHLIKIFFSGKIGSSTPSSVCSENNTLWHQKCVVLSQVDRLHGQ